MDILQMVAAKKHDAVHVGFALETTNVVAHAQDKLKKKNLDLIVANNPTVPNAGFAHPTNRVTIIDRSGKIIHLDEMSKFDLAHVILDHALQFLSAAGAPQPVRAKAGHTSTKNGRRSASAIRHR
jgi:phosphopantothenoylcysteine decarboxylase/phosphopantothenate--cysteine ligase